MLQRKKPASPSRANEASLLDLPPQNLGAEKGVLGAILIEPKRCDEITALVDAADFYRESHGKLFRRLVEMYHAGSGIDLTTLLDYLEKTGDLEEIGGEAYLGEIISEVPVAAHATLYARIVREKSIDRQRQEIGRELIALAGESTEGKTERIHVLTEKLRTLQERAAPRNLFVSASEAMVEVMQNIDNSDTASVVGTGFEELDKILMGGFRPGQSIILAARTSVGKTAFAGQLLVNMSVHQNVPAVFVTLEMSRLEIMQRIVCNLSDVPMEVANGFYKAAQYQTKKICEAVHKFDQSTFHIIEATTMSVEDLEFSLSAWMKDNELRLCFVDQLDKLTVANWEGKDDRERKSAVSTALKGAARRLGIPIVTLTQINREGAKQERPRVIDLKGSGQIEQDGDIVLLLHSEENANREKAESERKTGVIEVGIAKNRNGRRGVTLSLRHIGDRFRFGPILEEEQRAEASETQDNPAEKECPVENRRMF